MPAEEANTKLLNQAAKPIIYILYYYCLRMYVCFSIICKSLTLEGMRVGSGFVVVDDFHSQLLV